MKSISLLFISAVTIASSVMAAPTGTEESRNEKWSKMKIALPDGLFPEDVAISQRMQYPNSKQEEDIVPMIIMEEDELPPASTPNLKSALRKHQLKDKNEKGYKHLGAASSEQSFRPMLIAPLLPSEQDKIKQEQKQGSNNQDQVAAASIKEENKEESGMRYKKLIALTDKGYYQAIDLPDILSVKPASNQVEEQVLPKGVSENEVIGIDTLGKMRFIDVPYYNRASI